MANGLNRLFGARGAESDPADAGSVPLGGTRGEAMQRLQVGIGGLTAMILLIGLASIFSEHGERAGEAEPVAAASEENPETPSTDPLVDAGVVPDLPADPSEEGIEGEGLPPAPATGASPPTGAR